MSRTPENPIHSQEGLSKQDKFIRLDEPAHSNFHYSMFYRGPGYGRMELNDTFLRRIIQRGGVSGPLCHLVINSAQAPDEQKNIDGVNPDGTITNNAGVKREKPIDEMLTPTSFYTLKLMSQREEIRDLDGKVEKTIAPGWVIELHGRDMLKRIDARYAKSQKNYTQAERFNSLARVLDRSLKTALLHVSLLESISIRDKVERKNSNIDRGILGFIGMLSYEFNNGVKLYSSSNRQIMELLNHLSANITQSFEDHTDAVDRLDTESISYDERKATRNFRKRNFSEEYEKQQEKWKEYLLVRYRLPAVELFFPFFKAFHNTGYELARHPLTPLIRATKPRILTR